MSVPLTGFMHVAQKDCALPVFYPIFVAFVGFMSGVLWRPNHFLAKKSPNSNVIGDAAAGRFVKSDRSVTARFTEKVFTDRNSEVDYSLFWRTSCLLKKSECFER